MRGEKNDEKMKSEIEIKINQKTLFKGLGTSNICLFAIKVRISSIVSFFILFLPYFYDSETICYKQIGYHMSPFTGRKIIVLVSI